MTYKEEIMQKLENIDDEAFLLFIVSIIKGYETKESSS